MCCFIEFAKAQVGGRKSKTCLQAMTVPKDNGFLQRVSRFVVLAFGEEDSSEDVPTFGTGTSCNDTSSKSFRPICLSKNDVAAGQIL